MENRREKSEVVVGILAFVIAVVIKSVQAGGNEASPNGSKDVKLAKPPRGTVKSVQSVGGNVIDCVDIYKQPAFDHPLLKNHTLQMKPSFQKEGDHDSQGLPAGLEGWGAGCPKGTIPIIKKTSRDGPYVKKYFPWFLRDQKSLNNGSVHVNDDGEVEIHEYATVQAVDQHTEGTYHGARATHNIWNPHVAEPRSISVSQVWISGGPKENIETIEAGWIAGLKHDVRASFFTYWTSDNYRTTGCYNTRCPGFVSTNPEFLPGAIMQPISQYGGQQFEYEIQIEQDPDTNSWWLQVGGMNIGYWPANLFNALRAGARRIDWGGEVAYFPTTNEHTRTHMGSGRLPRSGYYSKSAFIRNLAWAKSTYGLATTVPREALIDAVTNRNCYDLVMGPNSDHFETHFYYGGPGYSEQCRFYG